MDASFENLVAATGKLTRQALWRGTFAQYYDRVKQDPSLVKTAHQRLYHAIVRHGVEEIDTSSDKRLYRIYGGRARKILRYKYFEGEFFGLDLVIMRIMEFLKAAASSGEESRQLLYFIGPVGSGKTSMLDHMKRALELSEPFYALEGCPIHEEPLHLIPKELRPRWAELLGVPLESFQGHLCPLCKQRLRDEFHGEFADFPVVTHRYSSEDGMGIGVLPPSDENSMDVSLLIGRENLGLIGKYGENDPRVLELDGALNRGNRGIVDLYELNKNPVPLLLPLLSATQEKRYRAPGQHPMLYFDGVLVAHSNETEFERFRSDKRNEALVDRMVPIKFRYPLQVSDQRKILEKVIVREANFLSNEGKPAHIAPGTLEVCALFTALTVLRESNKVDPLTKVKLYDGQDVTEQSAREKPVDVRELYEEAGPREGLDGFSTRFATKAMGAALARTPDCRCVSPVQVMEVLSEFIHDSDLPPEEREHLDDTILKGIVRRWYLKEVLREHIAMGFIHAYEESAEQMWQEYLEHVLAYNMREQVRDPKTYELEEPSEDLMAAMERPIGISGKAQADEFRSQIAAFVARRRQHNQTIRFTDHERIREAVKRRLFSSVADYTRVISRGAIKTGDDEERYARMVEAMIEDHGYCPICVDVVLRFAHNHNLFQQ
jgi:serine protein kinase